MNGFKNGNGWRISFWVMTTFCGIWLLTLTNGVVANDRRGQDERIAIRKDLVGYRGVLADKLETIACRLASIETELKHIRQGK